MHHKKIDYKKELLSAWEIAKLNKTAMHHASEGGKDQMKVALGIITIGSLFSVIGMRYIIGFFEPTFFYSLKTLIMGVIMPVAGIYILSFIAQKLFKGKAKHHGFFNVMGYGMIVTWLSLFTPLSIIGAFWMLVIVYKALKTVHKLKTTQAIGAMFLAFIAMAIISALTNPMSSNQIFNPSNYSKEIDFNFYGEKGGMKMDGNKIVIESEEGRVEIPIYSN